MKTALDTIERLIEANSKPEGEKLTNKEKGYLSGLQDALAAVKSSIFDLLQIGNHYFVITYKHEMPIVEEMRLFKRKNETCFFTRDLMVTHRCMFIKTSDLVLRTEKGIRERVFFRQCDAEKAAQKIIEKIREKKRK